VVESVNLTQGHEITAIRSEIRLKRHLANGHINICVVCLPGPALLQRRQSFCSLEALESIVLILCLQLVVT